MGTKQYQREYMRKRRAGENTVKENGLSHLIDSLEWKEIPGYEGYKVSVCGQILSTKLTQLKVLRQHLDSKGYPQVTVYIEKDTKKVRRKLLVHRAVFLTYTGDIPDNMVVDHIDGNKENTHRDNLQLLTYSQNISKGFQDAYNKGYQQALKDHNILTAEQAERFLAALEEPPSPNEKLMEAARKYREAIESGELVIKS